MLNDLAKDIHSDNVIAGWWVPFPNKRDRAETALMLSVTEIAEATEGWRKDLMDDHLPRHKMFDVELADAAIRLLDLAGAYDLDLSHLETRIEQVTRRLRSKSVPEHLYHIVQQMASSRHVGQRVTDSIVAVIAVARHNGVDLWPIVEEKRAYNAKRPDHKPAARAAKHGKKI